MAEANHKRNGEWLDKYVEDNKKVNYWGKWKVDNTNYPTVKVSNVYEEIESGMTDFIDYVVEYSNYTTDYVLGLSVVEFYAIMKRIDKKLTKRANALKKLG